MTNELSPTELAAEVVENWRPRFVSRFYEMNRVIPRVLNATGDFKQKGDIAHIEVEGFDLTVNSVAADGSLTVQTQTLTDVQVVINANKDVTMEWTGISMEQALGQWKNQFPTSAGNALRQKIELDLLAEYSNATLTAVGEAAGGANLGEDEILAAIQQHVDAKGPIMDSPEQYTFALASSQFGPLKKARLLDYERTGEAGEGGAASMKIGKLFNVPVIFSTQVATSSSVRKSLLFHETALAWAAQRNVEPRFADRLAAAKDSYIGTVLALYGVKTVVGARMCVINSK